MLYGFYVESVCIFHGQKTSSDNLCTLLALYDRLYHSENFSKTINFTIFMDFTAALKTNPARSCYWGEPKLGPLNVQNTTVVHAQRTTAKNRIETHFCSLV